MEEEKIIEDTAEEVQLDLNSEEARRQFLTKLAGAAGAVLAGGLLAGPADAQVTAQPTVSKQEVSVSRLRGTQVSFETLNNGIGLKLSGTQLTEALQREGLVPKAASMDPGKVMGIKLEWS